MACLNPEILLCVVADDMQPVIIATVLSARVVTSVRNIQSLSQFLQSNKYEFTQKNEGKPERQN